MFDTMFWTETHASSGRDEWETPPDVFAPLHDEFMFTLDAAASTANALCPRYFTADQDALVQEWGGERVFVNPPYGRQVTGQWVRKAYLSAQAGALVVLLLPARTDTAWWHDYVLPYGEVRFRRGRITFLLNGQPLRDDKGRAMPAPFPSAIVIFRPAENC